MKKTYAIIDIETTNSSFKKGKMIQFACALVQKDKVIQRFNTFINPEMPIHEGITQLTGITEEMVKDAPYFCDVAPILYDLLTDCTLVAHNAQFDVNFLNMQLEQEGLTPLSCPVMDTVQLAEVLFPTVEGYRLQNLAKELKLTHCHAHRADSDVEATVELFLALKENWQSLPSHIQKRVLHYADCFYENTGDFFSDFKTIEKNIDPKYIKIGIFSLLRKEEEIDTLSFSKVHKRQTIGIELPQEDRFLAYETMKNREKNSLCLIPKYEYQSWIERGYEVWDCASEYIDLELFQNYWDEPTSDEVRRLQIKLLIWLTETKTGCFHELRLKIRPNFFQQIAHRGLSFLQKRKRTYSYDFLVRQEEKIKHQGHIIMTQERFLEYEEEENPVRNTLYVDEATYFSFLLEENTKEYLSLQKFKKWQQQLTKEDFASKIEFPSEKQKRQWASYLPFLKKKTAFFYQKWKEYYQLGDLKILPSIEKMKNQLQQYITILNKGIQYIQKSQNRKREKKEIESFFIELIQWADYLYVYLESENMGIKTGVDEENQPYLFRDKKREWEFYIHIQEVGTIYLVDECLIKEEKSYYPLDHCFLWKKEISIPFSKEQDREVILYDQISSLSTNEFVYAYVNQQGIYSIKKWLIQGQKVYLPFATSFYYAFLFQNMKVTLMDTIQLTLWQEIFLEKLRRKNCIVERISFPREK